MLDFTNTKIAFESKSDRDLRRAQELFTLIKYPWIVSLCKVLTDAAHALRIPVGWAVKPTIYKHFVGGENIQECSQTLAKLYAYNVRAVLDYSAEGGQATADIQNTFDETIRSIVYAKNNPAVAYTVFKPTALTTDAILQKASEELPMTLEEVKGFEAFRERMEALCQKAYDLDVRILVDAEDYCFQKAIDRITNELMRKFNKKRAIVFTTFQMYRWDRFPLLECLYEDAVIHDYIVGMKFVRGAYMEAERERATRMGYPDPICPSKAATDENFNNGLRYTMNHLDHFEVFSGTHNESSNRLLADLIEHLGLSYNDPRVFFAQLYGMSDNLSYNLAYVGYNVVKYIPYAPVETVLPYLIRRAQENTAMAGQTTRELNLINSEIQRRKALRQGKGHIGF